ncbi:adhesion G-protein coupled receptor F3 [Eucyclogobius newberryi]|uniref:adhesion G-protein coupled receptor F3 n=1 Tax=Eucyclogobius newberryi TaxID=166745 RepID=UPI003B5BE181
MVESNITLDATNVISILNDSAVSVTDLGGTDHAVAFTEIESVAECLLVGVETTCNCSAGYTFSNEVCYSESSNYSCCSDITCTKNVSYITPLCIRKVPVFINGSVSIAWTQDAQDKLETKFKTLNGFKSLERLGDIFAFNVSLDVIFETARLQEVINTMQTELAAYIHVDTTGLVMIEHPQCKVKYQSNVVLRCMFNEATDNAGWNMSTETQRFELNEGSVVKLNRDCVSATMLSCVEVKLAQVTGAWQGTYECGFTKGSVRHRASAYLTVARLPDTIQVTSVPITGDCSEKETTDLIPFTVTATILKTNSTYTFTSQHNNVPIDVPTKIVPDAGKKFCQEESSDGVKWPNTPTDDTVIDRTCELGRVGYKSRTCKGTTWDSVFNLCVDEKLAEISNAADDFLKGLGATESVALDIFSGLTNSTSGSTGDGDNIADLTASIGVLDIMAKASNNVPLGEKILPNFVNAASNMLNKTWTQVNDTVVHKMSSNYLESLEGLVKNINVNMSNSSPNYSTSNLDLKYCSGENCNVEVFNISVYVNKSNGLMKTVGVKHLMHKLRNTFMNSKITDLLVSATTNSSSSHIKMRFPATAEKKENPHCVFWDTESRNWNNTGCKVVREANGSGVFCECNHLTSFSVLMARGDVSSPALDIITYVGLAVSIVSLIIFLIIEYLVWSAVVKTKLSHYRHTCMVNIAFFLLLADISFLASIEPSILSADMCLALTVCKHLFFTVKFSWMLCLSSMLVHQLIFVFNPLRKKVFMYFSSLVGYMFPIVIVGSSYIYYKYTGKDYYNPDTCWLTYERLLVGSLHSFLLPIGTILLTNIFSMGVVVMTLLKSSQNDSSKGDEKDTARSIIKVILVLAPVFGVTWSFGFCLVVFDETNGGYQVFNYIFTIVNSFQGLFVLLTGFMAEQKVKDELRKIVFGNKGSSDSTKNLTSTMYTKDK